MSTHTAYEHALDSLREVGKEVGQRVPSEVPVEWPDDLVARVAEDLVDSFGTVKTAVAPAAGVAAGVGVKAASSTGRLVREHRVLTAVGIGAAVALVIWMLRRKSSSEKTASDDRPRSVSQVA